MSDATSALEQPIVLELRSTSLLEPVGVVVPVSPAGSGSASDASKLEQPRSLAFLAQLTMELAIMSDAKRYALTQSDGDSKIKAATSAESPTPSGRSLTASKPAFLMTWEEREQARRQQKELDKAQRIEAEKMGLQQLQRERQRREDMDAGLARLAPRRRERAARTLQHALRSFLQRRIILAARQRRQCAVTLQRRIRAFLARHHWKTHVREELRQLREQRTMARCEDEAKQIAHAERQLMAQQQQQQQRVGGVDAQALSRDAEDEGHSAPAASALAAMWRKLRRVFVAAWERGTRVHELFRRLDERGDGVIDRAELRTGLRRFGVRIDRTMTRAYLPLSNVSLVL
ncbi:hypothetical protein ATCC90586_011950 [Pythium insidiosum]|nr:hypothetical protein ATCC90586_011950 [Pythium insidiosum]